MQKYVLGFAFNTARTQVALIEKNRPAWQAGKLNGIGGHVEPNEENIEAMVREFQEETGTPWTWNEDWQHFATMQGLDWVVYCFFTTEVDFTLLRTMTDEKVWTIRVDQLPPNTLMNLRWLIPLALDSELIHQRQRQPVVIDYQANEGDQG